MSKQILKEKKKNTPCDKCNQGNKQGAVMVHKWVRVRAVPVSMEWLEKASSTKVNFKLRPERFQDISPRSPNRQAYLLGCQDTF